MRPTPETTGDPEEVCPPAGESAALTRVVRPAGAVVRALVAEAGSLLGDRSPRPT